MNFLEAHKLVTQFKGGSPLSFLFAISGTPDKLELFLKAAGAIRGRAVEIRTLPFNTLGQTLMSDARPGEREVFVLFPWDLVPEADWRSGLDASNLEREVLEHQARQTIDRLARRPHARILYVTAPLPPLFADPSITARLAGFLSAAVISVGGELLPEQNFSLASYLSNGSPFASQQLGQVADAIVAAALAAAPEPKKVLITDLDNVMWRGVIGEDGLEGIRYLPEGTGFRHFLYQTFLLKVKREGALLAAVSRNDTELAHMPFKAGRMSLGMDDFVAVAASYNAKSAQIREIARQLNLGLDSFVFIDDNPIEIEEVAAAIPEIRAVQFPTNDDALPSFFAEVAGLFARSIVTAEDAERTAMYRRRLEGMLPTEADGADLTEFLRGLTMALTIHDRSAGDRTRAVQLINKTNQFNLNGRRVADDEVAALLSAGGRLYTCSLSDRTGSHGEILSCLIDGNGVIRSLVMSCRVFQRRVEYAFFVWLGARENAPRRLDFASTPRNEPMHQFLEDPAFAGREDGMPVIDWSEFARNHATDLALFDVTEPAAASNS
jgi:FkbH-like protein